MRAYLPAVPPVFAVRVRELLPAETVVWQFCVSRSSFLELNRQVFVTKRGARHFANYGQLLPNLVNLVKEELPTNRERVREWL